MVKGRAVLHGSVSLENLAPDPTPLRVVFEFRLRNDTSEMGIR